MLTLIAIVLSSSLLAAIFTGVTNIIMKNKELMVKLTLEDKNKWSECINKSYNFHSQIVTEQLNLHIEIFALYLKFGTSVRNSSIKKDNFNKELDLLNEKVESISSCMKKTIKKHDVAYNDLIFLIHQSTYVSECEVTKLINDIDNIRIDLVFLIHKKKEVKFDKFSNQEIENFVYETENSIMKKKRDISEDLAKLVKNEKEYMVEDILKGNIFTFVLKFFN